MRTIGYFTFGVIVALLAISYAAPQQTVYETQVVTRTVTEYEQLDIAKYRDVSKVSEHDDDILAECAYAIARQTDEPIAGIVIYVDRYWEGDTCAAYLHLVDHGWY